MYPRIPWELVADALESPEHTSGTAMTDHKSVAKVLDTITG